MDNTDEESDVTRYEPRLTQEWAQVLINLRMKYSSQFTKKRNSSAHAWKLIYQEMTDVGAPKFVTVEKLRKKWMNIVGKYKQLKFSDAKPDVVKWPYFEHLDRAYERNPSIIELRKNKQHTATGDDGEVPEISKENFIRNLIDLRYEHRHLFNGKKYAAQKGWMIIQSILPHGKDYSIEQISKRWQNLVQRYKHLVETEQDVNKIIWTHFAQMHRVMTKGDGAVGKDSVEDTSAKDLDPEETFADLSEGTNSDNETEDENHGDRTDERQPTTTRPKEWMCRPLKGKRKSKTSLDDLLEYYKERDKRRDEQFCEMMTALKAILSNLSK